MADSGPRAMKNTLQSRYHPGVAELTGEAALAAGGTIANPTAACKQVHSRAVANSIVARADNSVLGSPAPDVDDAEQELPRKTRRTLAQLRSGNCLALNSYQPRMGWSDTHHCVPAAETKSTLRSTFSSALLTRPPWSPTIYGRTPSRRRNS